jgi:predicted dehydrogenase
MLADPNLDLIDICLPPSWHAKTAVSALKAGKHVFCEKPIALKIDDGLRMVQMARQCGKMLLIGHVVPFFPEFNFVYETILGGKHGKITGGHFKRIISDPTWLPDYFDPEKVGGPMLDLHIHDAHFIRLVVGMPKQVQCVGRMRGEVLERFATQFSFADPSLFVTASSGVIPQQGRPFNYAFEIYLERATILCEYAAIPQVGDLVTPLTLLLEDGKVERPAIVGSDSLAPFVAELGEAVHSISTNTPSDILSGELALDALTLCHRQTASAKLGNAMPTI